MIFTNVTEIKKSADLLDLILYLEKERANQNAPSVLRALSPNWLVNSNPQPGGTGGPGGWPLEAEPPGGNNWKFQLFDKLGATTLLPSANGEGDGEGVHIVILDTVPSEEALKLAKYRNLYADYPPLNDILNDDSLHIQKAAVADLAMTVDYNTPGHPYLMRGHGLFVAGIIHTIAPKATLHLCEVLNSYGVGTFESFSHQLEKILLDKKIGRPLIINCSFTLATPVAGTKNPDFPDVNVDSIKSDLEPFFDELAKEGVTIIAAAGNDAKCNNANPSTRRPHARYPAAYKNVWGVGALPKDFPRLENGRFKAASYSNLADETPKSGYITLGGEAGPEKGILGVYISKFPKPAGCLWFLWNLLTPGNAWYEKCIPHRLFWNFVCVKDQPNTTGWAWWSGTSFATAIVSGILAVKQSQSGILGASLNIQPPDQLLAPLIQPNLTYQNEKVILMKQEGELY